MKSSENIQDIAVELTKDEDIKSVFIEVEMFDGSKLSNKVTKPEKQEH